jgi:cytochrome P450
MEVVPAEVVGNIERMLASPELFQDPYPTYAELREHHPIYFSETWGAWIATRYDDIHGMLRDPERFSSRGRFGASLDALPAEVRRRIDPLYHHFTSGLIHSDPPNHTRLRALVRHAFTPRMIEQLRPRIEALVNELLDGVVAAGEFEVVRDLAFPLPAIVIAEMLGADADDRDRFKHWSDEAVGFQGVANVDADLVERSQAALLDMKDYLRSLIKLRRQAPKDDVLTTLALAEEDGERLTEEELVATGVTLLIAGHETTTSLIGNAMYTFLTQDGVVEQLTDDPALVEPAVEEVLRYETPKQRDFRLLTTEVELHGETMEAGQLVIQLLGAANRDPREFDDPDSFVLDRQPNRHIAFGFGIHFCLGSPLARLEARAALSAVLRRTRKLELASDGVHWEEKNLFRTPAAVPVRFQPA